MESKSWLNKNRRRRKKKRDLIDKVCYTMGHTFMRSLTKDERKSLALR